MPTYQYQCTECGEGLEAVQKFTDNALTECPNCGGRLKKVFSAVGIVFKGSGFYRNDSRGSSSSSSCGVQAVDHVDFVLAVDDLVVLVGLEVVGQRLVEQQLGRVGLSRRDPVVVRRWGPRCFRETASSTFSESDLRSPLL